MRMIRIQSWIWTCVLTLCLPVTCYMSLCLWCCFFYNLDFDLLEFNEQTWAGVDPSMIMHGCYINIFRMHHLSLCIQWTVISQNLPLNDSLQITNAHFHFCLTLQAVIRGWTLSPATLCPELLTVVLIGAQSGGASVSGQGTDGQVSPVYWSPMRCTRRWCCSPNQASRQKLLTMIVAINWLHCTFMDFMSE